jgi:NAD(P)-dependent dehydrogenase (short-subunit alcohol dehydrogenase family)
VSPTASESWTPDDLPDLTGRLVVVTGANSGLGLEATVLLAGRGARVVMACRDAGRGEAARAQVVERVPGAAGSVEVRELDLADLSSVEAFAEGLAEREDRLDVLLNNAGVMAIPKRRTADGFEMQLGTNHLGHVALTAAVWPLLLAAGRDGSHGDARVVTVSSDAHRFGRLDRTNLAWEHGYRRWRAYGLSKLANLLFTFELDRRLHGTGVPVRSVAAHPGVSGTDLFADPLPGPLKGLGVAVNRLVTSTPAVASWPQVRAATDPEVLSGAYLGPSGVGRFASGAVRQQPDPKALDADDGEWLWEESADLVGIDPDFVTRDLDV